MELSGTLYERVHMEILWAPWRLSYVAAARPQQQDDPCFICQGLGRQDDRQSLIVLRTGHSVVLLNRFPYNNGHLLVGPQAHKGKLEELTPEELLDTMESVRRMTRTAITSASISAGLPAPGCQDTCTGTSSRAGTATRTSCLF